MATQMGWDGLISQIKQVVDKIHSPEEIVAHKQTILDSLGKYNSDEADFSKFVNYDEKGFTKNLVVTIGDTCNVIIMCWAPGQMSSIHSHNGSRCFVKILIGQLHELRLKCPTASEPIVRVNLDEKEAQLLKANQVTYIDDEIGAHKVINKSTSEPAVSMHVYVPAYKTSKVYTSIENKSADIELSIDNCRPVDLDFYHSDKLVEDWANLLAASRAEYITSLTATPS